MTTWLKNLSSGLTVQLSTGLFVSAGDDNVSHHCHLQAVKQKERLWIGMIHLQVLLYNKSFREEDEWANG